MFCRFPTHIVKECVTPANTTMQWSRELEEMIESLEQKINEEDHAEISIEGP